MTDSEKLDWSMIRRVATQVARGKGLRAEEAEDVAGDVLADLARRGIPEGANVSAYVRAAAERECGRAIGQRRRRREREVRGLEETLVSPGAADPSAREIVVEAFEAIRSSLAELGEMDRSLLALVAAGLRSAQIASITGQSPEGVRKRLQRARERAEASDLQERLEAIAAALPDLSPRERLAALAAVGLTCSQAASILGRPGPAPDVGRRTRRRVDEAMMGQIEVMVAQGLSGYQIAKRLGIHRGSVAWARRRSRG